LQVPAVVDELEKMRAALRALPDPEPRAGFVDRVLAAAAANPATAGAVRGRRKPRRVGWIAAGSALAASLALITWLPTTSRTSPDSAPAVTLALHESRDVALVIDAERDLKDATIRLIVSGSVSLAGYEDQREIEWLTSLTHGANLLSLPVVAHSEGDGRLVAVIEHEGRSRQVTIALTVAGQPQAGIPPQVYSEGGRA
jgi:hypothetical protein